METTHLIEKEEFESQLADRESTEEELQKQKEDAETEVSIESIIMQHTHATVSVCSFLLLRPGVYATWGAGRGVSATWGAKVGLKNQSPWLAVVEDRMMLRSLICTHH